MDHDLTPHGKNAVRDLDHGLRPRTRLLTAIRSQHDHPTATPEPDPEFDARRGRAPDEAPARLMIWLAVFPTLLVLNLALGDWLRTLTPVLRTFVLATIAVPIVIYGLIPQLHRARRRLLTRNAG